MKLLIVNRCDHNVKDVTNITHPIIRMYAEMCGADFLQLGPNFDSKVKGDGKHHFRILALYDLLDTYDRILHIDSDIIINSNAPNIFEEVPYDSIGTIYEDIGSRANDRHNTMKEAQRFFGDINWSNGYINTGIFLVSREHKEIFTEIDGKLWTGWGSDDVHLGYQIKKQGHKVYELPFKYNHMTIFSEPWNNSADRFNSYFIHYAGKHTFNKNKPYLQEIIEDRNKIWGDYFS